MGAAENAGAWGLIAGNGDFPFLVLEGARSRGIEMAVIAIREEASPALERAAKRLHWISLGELSRGIDLLHEEGVKHAVMAGQVKHNKIFSGIRPDWRLAKLLLSLPSKNTDSLIGAVARVLQDEGIELVDSTKFLGPLLPAEGVLTSRAPNNEESADIAYGRNVAQQIAGMDLGQTVVIRDRACVAVEAMEGTDETIERAARIAGGQRLVVVKVSKPKQDMRFDVPVIGAKTIETMRRANAMALAIDARRTLLFERDVLIAAADDAGIAIQAFAPAASASQSEAKKKIVGDRNIRVAVFGVGEFGRNHVRVCRELPGVELAGVFDANSARASKVAAEFSTRAFSTASDLIAARPDAVCVAVPTREHARVGCLLLEAGFDVLVEKPMAASLQEADALIASAKSAGRILQIGHLERFNPAVIAVQSIVNRPMFFEVHRLGVFTPRSLDVDVVYDVMIHDLDILLSLVDSPVVDLKAVGIPVMTDKVDIAQARIEFATGTVANVTASRVSTERVRKMRFFQEHEYVSLDFTRQDLLRVRVQQPPSAPSALMPDDGQPEINFEKVPTTPGEPLRAELSSFIDCVRTRKAPIVNGHAGRLALELADRVMTGILDHARRVQLGAFSPQAVQ